MFLLQVSWLSDRLLSFMPEVQHPRIAVRAHELIVLRAQRPEPSLVCAVLPVSFTPSDLNKAHSAKNLFLNNMIKC